MGRADTAFFCGGAAHLLFAPRLPSPPHPKLAGVECTSPAALLRAMPHTECVLDGRSLTVAEVVRVARDRAVRVAVNSPARAALLESRRLVEAAVASGQTIYGINTGF